MRSDMLENYFKNVGKHQLLTREQEVELAQRIEKGDDLARQIMIESNLRLAISVAKKYSRYGSDLEDLIQESNIGLMKAVEKFDWRRGFKFSTYDCWWIKQSVKQHIASQSGTIKLPSYAKNTLWKMKKMKEEYEEEFGVSPSDQEVADLLGTSVSTLNSLIKCSSTMVNLDSSAYRGDDGNRTMHEILIDNSIENVEREMDKQRLIKAIKAALKDLTPREEAVLRMRFGISEPDLEVALSKKEVI